MSISNKKSIVVVATISVILILGACVLGEVNPTAAELWGTTKVAETQVVLVVSPTQIFPAETTNLPDVTNKSIPIDFTKTLTPSKVTQTYTPTAIIQEVPWWKSAVFYEIFVGSFYDSNNDGIGDFNGILEKLDYLNDGNPDNTTDLGVTAIWLMPIHPSPSTHGYDVTDYYSMNF